MAMGIIAALTGGFLVLYYGRKMAVVVAVTELID